MKRPSADLEDLSTGELSSEMDGKPAHEIYVEPQAPFCLVLSDFPPVFGEQVPDIDASIEGRREDFIKKTR